MKRGLAGILLALVVMLSVPFFSVTAKTTSRIADINEVYWEESTLSRSATLMGEAVGDIESLVVVPGEEVLLPLPAEAFTDNLGSPIEATITASTLSEGKVGVKYKVLAGPQTLQGIHLQADSENGASIVIQFQPELIQTKELEFEYLVYLTVKGQRKTASEFTVSGTIANPVIEVGPDTTKLDLSGGLVAEATSYVKNVTVELGNGVTIRSSLFEGSRYYGTAKVEDSLGTFLLLEEYPEVKLLYTLQTIGLKREGKDVVSIDISERYYVYNSEGSYIGTTDKALPYSAKYYLASSNVGKIDLSGIM